MAACSTLRLHSSGWWLCLRSGDLRQQPGSFGRACFPGAARRFSGTLCLPGCRITDPLLTVLMIVIGGICFWHGFEWVRSRPMTMPWTAVDLRLPVGFRLSSVSRAAIAVLLVGLNLAYAWEARQSYRAFLPLDFSGARNVRVEAAKAATLRAIVARIKTSCGTLITEPGLFSFHLWTGKPSPRGIDHQVWMSLLDDASQAAVVREICQGSAGVCRIPAGRGRHVDTWVERLRKAGSALHSREFSRGLCERRLQPADAELASPTSSLRTVAPFRL